jgi:diadenosine tetraphosphate (Ap4A) HIT family hydrolase
MKYPELKNFVQKRMRMSHIYQPVMIMALLRHHGKCSVTQIAKAILAHDESQIEYYKRITNNMVGRVLRNHGVVEKDGDNYFLSGYDRLRPEQVEDLMALCRQKLDEYIEKRTLKESYHHREKGCLFCEISKQRIIDENTLAYAVRDHYPVTPGHALVIPKRHVRQYFDLSQVELNACNKLLGQVREVTEKDDPAIRGFNIGVNNGETAGQSIFHCHIHLIPRRPGDVPNPRGGVRHVIPGKGFY